jgi:hypothetical protein
MSDIPAGWAALLSAPLGVEPPDDTPLAVLPCLVEFPELPGALATDRPLRTEP